MIILIKQKANKYTGTFLCILINWAYFQYISFLFQYNKTREFISVQFLYFKCDDFSFELNLFFRIAYASSTSKTICWSILLKEM